MNNLFKEKELNNLISRNKMEVLSRFMGTDLDCAYALQFKNAPKNNYGNAKKSLHFLYRPYNDVLFSKNLTEGFMNEIEFISYIQSYFKTVK